MKKEVNVAKFFYSKRGNRWEVWDLVWLCRVCDIIEVGIVFTKGGEVVFQGEANMAIGYISKYGTPDMKLATFTIHDSEPLLNQLVSNKIATQMLFSFESFDLVKKGSMN
jgi:hypothetical protein